MIRPLAEKWNSVPLFLYVNPLNAELNPICQFLALLGAHPILHVRRIRVNILVKNLLFNLPNYFFGIWNLISISSRFSEENSLRENAKDLAVIYT